jgi:hypothetical protein
MTLETHSLVTMLFEVKSKVSVDTVRRRLRCAEQCTGYKRPTLDTSVCIVLCSVSTIFVSDIYRTAPWQVRPLLSQRTVRLC